MWHGTDIGHGAGCGKIVTILVYELLHINLRSELAGGVVGTWPWAGKPQKMLYRIIALTSFTWALHGVGAPCGGRPIGDSGRPQKAGAAWDGHPMHTTSSPGVSVPPPTSGAAGGGAGVPRYASEWEIERFCKLYG